LRVAQSGSVSWGTSDTAQVIGTAAGEPRRMFRVLRGLARSSPRSASVPTTDTCLVVGSFNTCLRYLYDYFRAGSYVTVPEYLFRLPCREGVPLSIIQSQTLVPVQCAQHRPRISLMRGNERDGGAERRMR